MFNNVALDVFIGLVFVFLLYSLMATIIQEMIATRFAFRAKVLEKAILRMLEDGKTTTWLPYGDRIQGILHVFGLKNLLKGKTVAPWFYAHPLIKYLAEDNWYSKPAYLTASNFSKVMIDLLKGFDHPESEIIQSIHNSITAGIIHKLPINISDTANPAIKIIKNQNPAITDPAQFLDETIAINTNTAFFLKTLWQDSNADLDVFKSKLEQWFNDTMERATGWYKKYTRVILFVTGFVVAYACNVDTIAIHRILSTNRTAREQMVQMAINSSQSLEPGPILAKDSTSRQSESLLDSTYKLVAADAGKSNDVLGLGRPWKDTCKMCRDSLKDAKFIKRFDSLQKINNKIKDSVLVLMASVSNFDNTINSLLRKTNDSLANTDSLGVLKQRVSSDSILLKQYLAYHQPEYDRMQTLRQRCAFISKMREHKWNLYSPNQAGGWETFFGWLITALAITLGAPFWFDLLSKLISLRGSGNIITPTADNTTDTHTTTAPVNPVIVNVNPNTSGEAAG